MVKNMSRTEVLGRHGLRGHEFRVSLARPSVEYPASELYVAMIEWMLQLLPPRFFCLIQNRDMISLAKTRSKCMWDPSEPRVGSRSQDGF